MSEKFVRFAFCIWLLCVAAGIGGLLYIFIHFVSKFW